ncbi:hypothetical protein HNV12_00445 [Methanococcoides sp. SA1]|nr:hypothetical protein [Methanococcoides sp. SA1]
MKKVVGEKEVALKKKVSSEKSFDWTHWLFLATIILVAVVAWFWFFGYETCGDKECFDESLKNCDRAKFVGGEDMIFEYFIKGKSGETCEVGVKLLQGELDLEASERLEGQEMNCFVPLGVVVAPESDIGSCHGGLKEGLQELVIEKLHSYLVQNLGKLNFEVSGVPSGFGL